jgi:hypothetical protein
MPDGAGFRQQPHVVGHLCGETMMLLRCGERPTKGRLRDGRGVGTRLVAPLRSERSDTLVLPQPCLLGLTLVSRVQRLVSVGAGREARAEGSVGRYPLEQRLWFGEDVFQN